MVHPQTLDSALDYNQFATWLAHNRGLVIGVPKDMGACPLAVYLRETLPDVSSIRVRRTAIDVSYQAGRETRSLPLWAALFVESVDHAKTALVAEEASNHLLPRELLP